jgi:hypothetical protein
MENTIMEVRRLGRTLGMDGANGEGKGELVKLAREVSHDGTVLCLSQLRRRELEELLARLEAIQAGCVHRSWERAEELTVA